MSGVRVITLLWVCCSGFYAQWAPAQSLTEPALKDCVTGHGVPYLPLEAMAAGKSLSLRQFKEHLADSQLVLFGEIHNRYDHHLLQTVLVCLMAQDPRPLAVGLEAFQVIFQEVLDDFSAGRIGWTELLERSGYFERWGYDFRHYAPVLKVAKHAGVRLVALNAPRELTDAVAKVGLAGLSAEVRRSLIAMPEQPSDAYRQRLQRVFAHHEGRRREGLTQFIDVQQVWDETMAAVAAQFLHDYPDSRLLIIAGRGHIAHPGAIPDRIAKRLGTKGRIVLVQDVMGEVTGEAALLEHLVLRTREVRLSPAGRLGVFLEHRAQAEGVHIARFSEGSAARDAGLQTGDRLLRLDGRPLARYEDVKLALWDKPPGATVMLTVGRPQLTIEVTVSVTLR